MDIGHVTRRRFFSLVGLVGAEALLPATMLHAVEPRVRDEPYNTLTEEEEIALGRKFSAEYEKKVEILKNPLIDVYLNRVVRKLGDASQRPHWPYQVKVVNSPIINAIAIPGGFLYVNRGLLAYVEDENEMAGALAHRIGAPHTVIASGACCIAGALWFTFKLPKVNAGMRPIYQEMGVLLERKTSELV